MSPCSHLLVEVDMIEITSGHLSPEQIINKVRKDRHGAVVTFIGTVRSPSQGKEVLYLEYEAYEEMARKKLQQIIDEINQKWQLQDVAISHRTGKVNAGETALVIVVAAPHRQEAFEACQYAVDRLKQIAPFWKKEVYKEGESWVEHPN